MNLFCIPFAGGSSYSYKGLYDMLPSSVRAVTFELPGRGLRFSEPLLTDAGSLVEDLYRQLQDELQEPYALYGHSLGSLLAFLLARRVEVIGLRRPSYLFLSGCEAPSVIPREIRHLLPKAAFREVVQKFGGCAPGVLESEELMEIFEPILRADFKAYETYVHESGVRIDVPIAAMIGEEEPLEREDVMKWQEETARGITLEIFPGDHFFIYSHWNAIAGLISRCLSMPAV